MYEGEREATYLISTHFSFMVAVTNRWTSKLAALNSLIILARRPSAGVSVRVEVNTMVRTTSTARSE